MWLDQWLSKLCSVEPREEGCPRSTSRVILYRRKWGEQKQCAAAIPVLLAPGAMSILSRMTLGKTEDLESSHSKTLSSFLYIMFSEE